MTVLGILTVKYSIQSLPMIVPDVCGISVVLLWCTAELGELGELGIGLMMRAQPSLGWVLVSQ